ncbi:DNA polymerase/3'-5' exonuclease PolX [Anaeromyxobacter paludicola]|uniref:DNA polymerase beta n=1 Tax=Anaeromyxobacter paludicola TaxID=2918171 RepID=A0ABM7X5F8_9BACT|nr:DNA polymerase/3'-5' exonuclease PolX [Anaeromyxobacter paludicola]BDG07043.1 DNA polymerase/3'-5' exonuclease PolX [Anaeromyxobacter paludicola]
MLDKLGVARALRELSALLQVQGENPFKVRAYETAARSLEDSPDDLAALVRDGRLRELPGVGAAIEKKISELHATGHTPLLDRLHAELPPGILELVEVPELGPRKIGQLHAELGVDGIAALEAACVAGRVRELRGFGEKTERKILEGIRRLRERPARRMLLPEALSLGERLLAHLRRAPGCLRAELAGSLRRGRETVGDLDLVAAAEAPGPVLDQLLAWPGVEAVLGRGEAGLSVRLAEGAQVDLRVSPPGGFPALLHHLTGSKAHHVRLRGLARDRGLTLSERGLERLDGGGALPAGSEEELYAALGLAFVPPELREDRGEIEAARDGALPDLVREEDVRGLVHCHTRFSDGRATLEELARAADALGMEYLTVTDHSPAASYAGGVGLDRLQAQWDEIARVQALVKVRLLRGTESDILEDGALDYPDRILEQLDVVVASVHSRFRQGEDEMTRRLVRAMRLPFFKIWGHALGRLLLEREPFACRMEEVLDAAAESGKAAVEVNGDPKRLEMTPEHLRLARARGLPVVLSVDAHSVAALGHLRWAVATARRGWVTRDAVLNARPLAEFARAVRPAG